MAVPRAQWQKSARSARAQRHQTTVVSAQREPPNSGHITRSSTRVRAARSSKAAGHSEMVAPTSRACCARARAASADRSARNGQVWGGAGPGAAAGPRGSMYEGGLRRPRARRRSQRDDGSYSSTASPSCDCTHSAAPLLVCTALSCSFAPSHSAQYVLTPRRPASGRRPQRITQPSQPVVVGDDVVVFFFFLGALTVPTWAPLPPSCPSFSSGWR